MSLDYKAIGEAALAVYTHNDADDAVLEKIGRAAVAKMIPAAVHYPHLGMFGICNHDCPFHRNDEQSGFDCTVGLAVKSQHKHGDYEESVMKPGPDCPASAGQVKAKE